MELIKEEKILFPLKGYHNNDDYQTAKMPAVKEWQKKTGLDDRAIQNFIGKNHWLGMAIKNTTVVDLDTIINKDTGEIVQKGHDVGEMVIEALRQKDLNFHAIRTPNGYQLIFNHTDGIKNNTKQVTPLGVISDYRIKDKGYIVYPTKNTDGRYFVHEANGPLSDVPDLLQPMKKYHKNIKFLPIYPIEDGTQNDTIQRWLSEVHNFKDSERVRDIGHIMGDYLCAPPYDSPDMLNRTIDSVLQQSKRDISEAPEFDVLIDGCLDGKDLRKALKKQRRYELAALEEAWEDQGSKGRKPTTISAIRCAMVLQEYVRFALFDLEENTKLAMYLPDEGIYTQNATRIQRVISWLEPKHNENKAKEIIYHISNMSDVMEKTNDRYLIPVDNGIFNIKTRQLEPFSPDYVFTTKISTKYIETPVNPVIDGWDLESWIRSIACNDEQVINLLWQVINDSLNGNYTRKKAIFLIGEGNNGKGTFQELLSELIGDANVASLKVNEFDERFKLSVLEGKTAVIGDDVPANVYVDDSSNFNSVVTGDRVLVEFKGQPLYSTVFRCSVIQSTNGMPSFKNKTQGTLRRLIIVPFNADFNGDLENAAIKDDYIKRPEVLQYVLHKAINMDFEKFDIPDVSLKELEIFKQDNDPVYEFKVNVFDDWNIPRVPKYIVYGFYKKYCEDNGFKPLSTRKFYSQFEKHLSKDWRTDAVHRFEWHYLAKYIGDLDQMDAGVVFPDPKKQYKSYENEVDGII